MQRFNNDNKSASESSLTSSHIRVVESEPTSKQNTAERYYNGLFFKYNKPSIEEQIKLSKLIRLGC